MKTYTCIIIDDHLPSQEILKEYISRVPSLNIEYIFKNAIDSLDRLQARLPDILFIDIEMPSLTGIDFLKTLKLIPSVIITTAHTSYAKESFDVGATDFLHKPYSFERFLTAVNRVIDSKSNKVIHEIEYSTFIFLKSGIQLNKISFDEIIYIEAYGNYTKFYLSTNKVELITESLSVIEKKIPSTEFCRIHKSYIVSKKYISVIKNKNLMLENIELPIGDSYKKNLTNV
jgi:DNA-binding LytR/AlgR family response regulator